MSQQRKRWGNTMDDGWVMLVGRRSPKNLRRALKSERMKKILRITNALLNEGDPVHGSVPSKFWLEKYK